jgi:hypothetical protein
MKWTQEEESWLIANYPTVGLKASSEHLNRPPCTVRSRASLLRLKRDSSSPFFLDWQKRAAESKVGKKRPGQAEVMRRLHREGKLIRSDEANRKIGESLKKHIQIHGHNRGALGMIHGEAVRRSSSERSNRMWADQNSYVNSDEYRQIVSDRMTKLASIRPASNQYSRCKRGVREDIGGMFFRSKWEANYARYLNWMRGRGEIFKWEYEPDTFWFEAIKRGVRSYTPDFKIWDTESSTPRYIELKGYMDPKSLTKLKRMRIYHPAIRIDVFDEPCYKSLRKQMSSLIAGWEP